MEFLENLNEARLFPAGKYSLNKYSAKDITELLFLHILALQILKNEFHGASFAKEYVKGMGNLYNYNYWSSARNELYAFLHILDGKDSGPQVARLRDRRGTEEYLRTVDINRELIIRYLRGILSGRHEDSFDRRFLLQMEKDLRITNSYYRAIRRLAMNWQRQSHATRKLTMTRLLQFMRIKARRSEILPMIELVADKNNLEDAMLEPLDPTPEPEPDKKPKQKKSKKMNFLSKLALGAAGGAAGAVAGYYATRDKKK